MTEDELKAELRDQVATYADQLRRWMELDIEITESTRDIMQVARDEIEEDPSLFFELPRSQVDSHPSGETEKGEESSRGQVPFIAGGAAATFGDKLIEFIKKEIGPFKKAIRDILGNLDPSDLF
jgi:hypothetical protein